ncbi:hypothetical protein CEE58_15985 [Stenotrophomonas maltophilia]|nr:hypothetical protein [Stenotrophomonas maltophilia]OWQ61327.1 hypothetical protein CEE58_15985 [Stenotrophomonas maltophilia]
MKISFHCQTNWPTGRHRKRGEAALTGMDWCQVREMPFVPRRGDMIALGSDDYREVEQVFYQLPSGGPAGVDEIQVQVHFAFGEDTVPHHQDMIAAGWLEAC